MEQNPKSIGGYIIMEILGRGGMATVYRAFHPEEKKVVALKVIKSMDLNMRELFLKREKRFMREIKILSELHHPNIIHISDFGYDQEQNRIYLAMDYIKGFDLSHLICWEGCLSLTEALGLTEKIIQAISYFHKKNIVHRDLKPANILINEQRKPYVTDFGVAKILEAPLTSLTKPGSMLGSVTYMAPEQAAGNSDKVGFKVDIYSLGPSSSR